MNLIGTMYWTRKLNYKNVLFQKWLTLKIKI